MRSKSTIYEQNEKSSKYFSNLEKRNAINNTIKMVIEDETEFSNPKKISDCIEHFYTSLFKRSSNKSSHECFNFLDTIPTQLVSTKLNEILSKEITLDELSDALHSSENGKSPGNEGLSREFYLTFWERVAPIMLDSFLDRYAKGFLSPSQRQAIIKLIEKKDEDKRFYMQLAPHQSHQF